MFNSVQLYTTKINMHVFLNKKTNKKDLFLAKRLILNYHCGLECVFTSIVKTFYYLISMIDSIVYKLDYRHKL